MGELENKTQRLARRARRLEEEAELENQAEQRKAERMLREGLKLMSTTELQAMREYFERDDLEDWREGDEPLMRRLVELREQARCEETGEFPWCAETEGRKE
jgi:hypothetical protein